MSKSVIRTPTESRTISGATACQSIAGRSNATIIRLVDTSNPAMPCDDQSFDRSV